MQPIVTINEFTNTSEQVLVITPYNAMTDPAVVIPLAVFVVIVVGVLVYLYKKRVKKE